MHPLYFLHFNILNCRYNKPLQASVRAVTNGTLWALKREDFRGILMSEFSNLSSLKLLRSVDLLSRLTILQLSNIAESLLEVSFADGQKIVNEVHFFFSASDLHNKHILVASISLIFSLIHLCRMRTF